MEHLDAYTRFHRDVHDIPPPTEDDIVQTIIEFAHCVEHGEVWERRIAYAAACLNIKDSALIDRAFLDSVGE